MSTPQQPPDPVATAQDLTRALGAMAEEVKRLRAFGRHNRLFVIIDILLTVLLSGVGYLSVHAAQSASQANSAQLALCQAGNTARGQQVTLWTHLLSLPPASGQPRTKAQQQQIAAFEVYIHSIFKPRDCSRLGRK